MPRSIQNEKEKTALAPGIGTTWAKTLLSAAVVFLATFSIRYFLLHYKGSVGPGDFVGPLAIARNLLQGLKPYSGIGFVPYPLPAGLIALPFTLAPDRLAGTLFFSVTAAILAGAVVYRTGQLWRLLLVFSVPFVVAMEWTQWSVLITAAWYIPVLAPLMLLIKPQTALPVFLNRWGNFGYAIAVIVLVISLLVSPSWPRDWLNLSLDYQYLIPLFLPGGFLLALALLNFRNKRARLLLAMAVLPFRATYDLVPLFIIPETPLQMIILVIITWLTPVQMWYIAALIFVLWGMDLKTSKLRFLSFVKWIKEIAGRSI
jgi:hypothetical protein